MKLRILGIVEDCEPLLIPFMSSTVKAGFPSPATDYEEERLDLNKLLVKNKDATFYIRVEGQSMQFAHITDGDILIVDKSLQAYHNSIVVACLDGEFTLKRIQLKKGKVFLQPENPAFSTIEVNEENKLEVWGVVTYIIHKAK